MTAIIMGGSSIKQFTKTGGQLDAGAPSTKNGNVFPGGLVGRIVGRFFEYLVFLRSCRGRDVYSDTFLLESGHCTPHSHRGP